MTVLGTGGAVDKIKEGTFADMILLGPPALKELADGWQGRRQHDRARHSTRASALRCGQARQSPTSARPRPQEGAARRQIDRLQHRAERRAFLQGRSRQARHRGSGRPKMYNVPRRRWSACAWPRAMSRVGIHQIAELMPIAGHRHRRRSAGRAEHHDRLPDRADDHDQTAGCGAAFVKFISEPAAAPVVQQEWHGAGAAMNRRYAPMSCGSRAWRFASRLAFRLPRWRNRLPHRSRSASRFRCISASSRAAATTRSCGWCAQHRPASAGQSQRDPAQHAGRGRHAGLPAICTTRRRATAPSSR